MVEDRETFETTETTEGLMEQLRYLKARALLDYDYIFMARLHSIFCYLQEK